MVAETPKDAGKRLRGRLGFAAAVLLPFVWLAGIRLVYLHGAETSQDCFYHVAMADLGPAHCMARRLPQMTLSLWSERFSDKELVFHLLTSGIRFVQRRCGSSGAVPFHVSTLAFVLGVLGAFVYAAGSFQVRRIHVFSLLLIFISPFFTHRLSMLRPHLLSIILMLVSCVWLNRTRCRVDLWRPFVMGWVFAWSYSNPHFVLLPAVAFAVVTAREKPRLAVLIPVLAAAGIVVGFTIHPQAPNTFVNWKIQCVDVVLQSLSGRAPVGIGGELRAPGRDWLLLNGGLFVLFVTNVILFEGLRRKIGWRGIDRPVSAVFLMSCVATVGVFASMRSMEYACPFTVLAAALLFNAWRAVGVAPRFVVKHRRLLLALVYTLLVLLALCRGRREAREMTVAQARALNGFAHWAAQVQLPAGTAIANPVWSDFPLLIYSAPQFRYLLGLDPMFAYFHAPEKVARLERFRMGEVKLTPSELADLTGARFAFVSYYAWRLARDMHRDGFALLYQGADGWLFDLEPVPAGTVHGLDRRVEHGRIDVLAMRTAAPLTVGNNTVRFRCVCQ